MHIKLLDRLEGWPLGLGSRTSSQKDTGDCPLPPAPKAVVMPLWSERENEQAAAGTADSKNLPLKMFSEDNKLPLLLPHIPLIVHIASDSA